MSMLYVDEYKRVCHFIIIKIMIDYEKQILITKIKKNQQCSIYKVSLYKRENLKKTWESRIYDNILYQIERQKNDKIIKLSHSNWIYFIYNFAWRHYLLNIHNDIMLNSLYQLLKKIIMKLIAWIVFLIIELIYITKFKNFYIDVIKKIKRKKKRKLEKCDIVYRLNKKFKQVLFYVKFKRFTQFNIVNQWIKNEQKQIIRQLISIIISLLIKKTFAILHYVRVILNFVIVAQYNYHNETILSYLNHVLDKIDKFLKIFQKFRSLNKQTRKSYFNISKFHAMTHYIEFIKLYKNSTNIDFDVDETNHKIFFKIFFSRINKKKNYEK